MNNKVLVVGIIFLIGIGCSKEDINKADMIPGYWQVLEKTSVLINGIKSGETTRGYYIEFYDNNCGQRYDRDENPTAEFKWAYQESDEYDRILISTEITSSDSMSTGLYITQLHFISGMEEMNMQIFRESYRLIDDDDYDYNHLTYLVRQR